MSQKQTFFRLLFPALLLAFGTAALFPCTVAVVSGKATPDGRPLLWKNRDASAVDNKMVWLDGERFGFIGIINAADTSVEHIWAGINTAGFAIINSASRDLASGEDSMNDNGRFIKFALGRCADVPAFEKLLQSTRGQRRVGANYGVIDALGNACFFETQSDSFVKFDANDPLFAPQGFIVRTNYAYSAPVQNTGGGYIRFERADKLFQSAAAEGRLDYRFILQDAARDLANEKLYSQPLAAAVIRDPSAPLYVNTNDTINRNSTVSVAVFHGAARPEEAHLATMWVLLGQPVSTVAVPLWAAAGSVPAGAAGPSWAPLNEYAKAVTGYLYPDRRGHMPQYLNVTRLMHHQGEGILLLLLRLEDRIMAETKAKIKEWTAGKPEGSAILAFEEKTVTWVLQALRQAFPEIIPQE